MNEAKILYVVDSFDRFGATLQLDVLTREIAKNDNVHVATLAGKDTPSFMKSGDSNRMFHFLSDCPPQRHSLRTLAPLTWKLRKLIRELRPDIIHAFCCPAEQASLAASYDFESAKKFVTELHVRPAANITSESIDLFLARRANGYIATHDEIKKSLIEKKYPADRIAVIPSAVSRSSLGGTQSEPRDAARHELVQRIGKGTDVKIAGAVAPLVPPSRLKDLIWATDLLTCIRGDFHFVIFGRGPQRKRLERFAFQTEAGHHVHFIDSEVDAHKLIPGLDYFWHSHLNEPLPSATAHAMANSIPVVTVYGPGTSESIEHQVTGFAVNYGARDEFARWTKYLLEKTDSSMQLAAQGKESLVGRYSTLEMAESYREIYRKQ